jgi:hypothetical protein
LINDVDDAFHVVSDNAFHVVSDDAFAHLTIVS